MNYPKISIVIPIYNSSRYLNDCLNSLKKQTIRELEFILINDGSTDNSLEIMKEAEKNDSRFKVINKKNTGYGDSVNTGIAKAKGEYIGIVEPDDFCSNMMFEELYNVAKKKDAEIIRGNYYYYSEGFKSTHKSLFSKKQGRILRPIDNPEIFMEPPAIWSAIYKTEFLRENRINLLPTPGASYQDIGFYLKTLMVAKEVLFVNKPLYYYRVDNPNSSVRDKKKISAVVKEYNNVEEFTKDIENGEIFIKYCQPAKFGSYNWNLLRLSRKDQDTFIKKMKDEFKRERQEGILEKRLFPKKYWISLCILLKYPVFIYDFITSIRKALK